MCLGGGEQRKLRRGTYGNTNAGSFVATTDFDIF
jgi:hypothetical protein